MKVSVIIPTYNCERFVRQAVESALAQTYGNLEVIVVDDGSTDQTSNVLRPLQDRIQYVVQQNRERAAARNHGLRVATGDIVAFLDADDLWPHNHIQVALDALNGDPTCDLVWGDVIYMDVQGKELWRASQKNENEQIFEALLMKNFINQSSVVARKRCFSEVGGFNEDRELSGSEDWEMWLRIASRFSCRHLPNHFTYYRLHDSWTMSNPSVAERSMRHAFKIIINTPLYAARLPKKMSVVEARHFVTMAINYYAVGRMREARHLLVQALKHDKMLSVSAKYWFYFGRTLLSKNVSEWLRNKKHQMRNMVQK